MNALVLSNIKCGECPIRHRAVCSRCEGADLDILEKIKVYRSFKAGEQILWRGEAMDFVASVVHGVATLGKTLEDGRTQMVGLLLPSDFIGRPGRDRVEFDVVAASDVTLCCFERKPFENLLSVTPDLSKRLVEIALDELDAARDWMLLLGRKTAREKIATFIDMLIRRSSVEGLTAPHDALVLPLSREEIANYLGLTLETVSRQLSALKAQGILRFNDRRSFTVLSPDALHDITGNDCLH
ncbi:transcriptional regulator FnrL [Neptunicoccus sediminis]|uniref:transcriptional regulator FnrL n=1 Tax=Neptunicoccus sediminis TaxID=1892596 RepID=UPI0008461AAA|nr:helix-turn-helix domain-containing protein [Neptunicoccus sediminis]